MEVIIEEYGQEALARYSAIPISFRVESVLHVEQVDGGLGGLRFREEKVDNPYVKDYDVNNRPYRWAEDFDLSNWAFLLARDGERDVGGAVVVHDSPGVNMLEGRTDLGVLWDIRVSPDFRGRGIGRKLFDASVGWAKKRGCAQLKIETQNVNVPACRFYSRMGCTLGQVHRFAYASDPTVAHEVMLIWYYDLMRINN